MRVLIIGGSGLISRGIVTALTAMQAGITCFNRGRRLEGSPPVERTIIGDRDVPEEFERVLAKERFDVVIDMICYTPTQAEATLRAVGGRCGHLIFCSTLDIHGLDVFPRGVRDESAVQRPVSVYGRDKLACEELLFAAQDRFAMPVTVVRPCHTYGPEAGILDPVSRTVADRIARGLPILAVADGQTLWTSTHRDDVGRLFAGLCANPQAFGRSFNATRDIILCWRDMYRILAGVLGREEVGLVAAPRAWIVRQDPGRFAILDQNLGHHGAYTSAAACRVVPAFAPFVPLSVGLGEQVAWARATHRWIRAEEDPLYGSMVERLLAFGVPIDAAPALAGDPRPSGT